VLHPVCANNKNEGVAVIKTNVLLSFHNINKMSDPTNFKKMFHTSTVACTSIYSVTIYVFHQESPDDDVSRPKQVVNCEIKDIRLCDGNPFIFIRRN
jgi:hypothetical protein